MIDKLSKMSSEQLIEVVVNGKKYKYNKDVIEKAKSILKKRKVKTTEIQNKSEKIIINEINNQDKNETISRLYKKYARNTLFVVIAYPIMLLSSTFAGIGINNSFILFMAIVLFIISVIINYYNYIKGYFALIEILDKIEKSEVRPIVIFLIGMFFDIIAMIYYYFYIKNRIKEIK